MTLELRSPNKVRHRIITRTKTRYTAGGQLHQVRPTTRPTTERLEFTFDGLTRTMVDNLLALFTATAGNYITVYDEQNREWVGMVVSRNIPFEQTHRGDARDRQQDEDSYPCSLWRCTFDFEGVLQ